jgi:hypothetical protein
MATAAQVKWVPLNKVDRGPKKKTAAVVATPVRPPAAIAEPTAVAIAPANIGRTPVPEPVAPVAEAAGGLPLQITCFGGGTANKPTAAFGIGQSYASGSIGTHSWSGSGWGTTTVYGTRQQGFGDQVDVRLFSGDDRIRLPRTMLPPLHGGQDGWFKLKNVVANARSIRASAAVWLLNNPKVFIDRVTGTISISGRAGDYSGQCQAVQADAPAKF